MKNLLGGSFLFCLLANLLALFTYFFVIKTEISFIIQASAILVTLLTIFVALNQLATAWIYFDSRKRDMFGEVPFPNRSKKTSRQIGLFDLIFYLKRRGQHASKMDQDRGREVSTAYILVLIISWILIALLMTYFFYSITL